MDILIGILKFILGLGIGALAAAAVFTIYDIIRFAIESIREEEDDGDEYVCLFDANGRMVSDRPAPSNASTPQAEPEIRGFNIDDEIDELTGRQNA